MLKMTAVVEVDKAILQIDAVRLQLLNTLPKEGNAIKAEYAKTVATWEHHHPKFTVEKHLSRGATMPYVDVWTTYDIYIFLHNGTKIRHAKLSWPWVSKTTVRMLTSNPGVGEVLYVSRKYKAEGIKAREWTQEIIKIRQPIFEKNARADIAKALTK